MTINHPLRIRLCFFICAFLLAAASVGWAQDADLTPTDSEPAVMGMVSGHITNGTVTGSVPTGMSVQLLINEGSDLETRDALVYPDNSYIFDNVPIKTGTNYVVTALYRDRQFYSSLAKGDPAAPTMDLPLTIYELTEDPSVLSIVSTTIRIAPISFQDLGSGLEVIQSFLFKNSSDRLYTTRNDVGSGLFVSVVIPLPPGSIILGVDNAQRYVLAQEDFTVIDTLPVLPGENHPVMVTYFIPYATSAIIEQEVNYALEGDMRLLVWPESLNVTSDQVTFTGNETSEDRDYRVFEGALSLASGDVIRYELDGDAQPDSTVSQDNSLLVLVIIVVLGLALMVGAVYFLGRRRGLTRQQMVDLLTRQLETLEAQHSAGEINHDLYHHKRQSLKAQLAELLDDSEE